VNLVETNLIEFFEGMGSYAFLLSLLINILISVVGVLPTVFLTAANIHFFGFSDGVLISIVGESIGAIISFYLYRKGLKKIRVNSIQNNKWIVYLRNTEGVKAFLFIMSLRFIPFIPSVILTLAGAGSKMSLLSFSFASTIGKIPALLLEAYSIQEVLKMSWQGNMILSIAVIGLISAFVLKKKNKPNKHITN
jgi:uncharacterized membrane protein YdjX (TVP38/TMEM64 family)